MQLPYKWLFILYLLCLPVLSSYGGQTIALTSDCYAVFDGSGIEVTVTITNQGMAVVYCTELHAALENQSIYVPGPDELQPGAGDALNVRFTVPAARGHLPVEITVSYQDSAGSRHSIVDVISVLTTDINVMPQYPTLRMPEKIRLPPLRKSKKFSISLRDTREAQPHSTIEWHLPENFSIRQTAANQREKRSQDIAFIIEAVPEVRAGRYRGYLLLKQLSSDLSFSESRPFTIIVPSRKAIVKWLQLCVIAGGLMLIASFFCGWFRPGKRKHEYTVSINFDYIVLALILLYIGWHIPPRLLFINAPVVGGDTPAHLYIAARLQESLIHEVRIINWASGWWCGFPLFQYYFPLPYLIVALAGFGMPLNIAFRIVSVSGIFALPLTAYIAGRYLQLRRPAPVFMALASLPVIFDSSHTMWGVNTASTLAGMIANSISFALIPLVLAIVIRASHRKSLRIHSVLPLVLLILSHFFTSLLTAIALTGLLIAGNMRQKVRRLRNMAVPAGLSLLLTAWWWLPLLAKMPFSMEFGSNWQIDLLTTLPLMVWPAVFFFSLAFRTRHPPTKDTLRVLAVMGIAAVLLFLYGHRLSAVFVNVRLWPFIIWSIMTGGSIGLAGIWHHLTYQRLNIILLLLIIFCVTGSGEHYTKIRAEWNYRGAQQLDGYDLFNQMVTAVSDTPGRLAYEMHPHNKALGSSRIFEMTPYLNGKAVLEGGLVNSAAGALLAYYIQSETSKSYAGLPPLVTPAKFNPPNAVRHLELANVSHFVARSKSLKQAMDLFPEWRKTDDFGPWTLYESLSQNKNYVTVLQAPLSTVRLTRAQMKQAAMAWIQTHTYLNQPYILLQEGQDTPDSALPPVSYEDYLKMLNIKEEDFDHEKLYGNTGAVIYDEEITDNSIRFKTTAPGAPHLIKVSWFPNWQVRGASEVYALTPFFILVYPEQTEVELYYGFTAADRLGHLLSLCGALIAFIMLYKEKVKR